MRLLLQKLGLATVIILISACQSNPAEIYSDNFYQTSDPHSIKQFTYILYLGDGALDSHYSSEQSPSHSIPEDKRGNKKDKSKARKKSSKHKADDYSSISFQMEEEAYERLEIKLQKINFCPNEISYQLSEYSWLRYTIKGSCEKR